MNIQWFHDLARLRETGNFSHAAERNCVSQSAFSRRIQSLEQWAGAPLVDRATHPVRLTQSGEQLLEAGVQALHRLERERQQIQQLHAGGIDQMISFATQHSLSWHFYPNWLRQFEEQFEPINSRLRADNLPNCITDLERGDVDFLIAYESTSVPGISRNASFESLRIGNDCLIPVCKAEPDGSPRFKLCDASSDVIPYLRFSGDAPIGQHVLPMLNTLSITHRLSPIYENAMVGALRIRACDGLGVAWLPESVVSPDLDEGRLVLAAKEDFSIALDINLFKRQGNNCLTVQRIWNFLQLQHVQSVSGERIAG